MLPLFGSVFATSIKAIFHAVGDSAAVTKAVTKLGIHCGGSGKIVSKLDGISKGLKKLANNIPNVIATLKNNYFIKMRIGKKQFNNIVSDVRNGMNSLITYSNQVISTVKTAVKKSVKEEAKTQSYGSLKMNLQFFARKTVSNMAEFFENGFGKSIKNQASKTTLKYDGQSIYRITGKTGSKY